MHKVFVPVIVRHEPDGSMKPLCVEWEDGRKFEVDKILDIRRSASLKAGGCGFRYTVRMKGRQAYLFYDLSDKKWFVEAK